MADDSLWGKLEQTWPARAAQGLWDGLTLPGDVYQGNVSMYGADGHTNPQVISRAADLAGSVTLGAGAVPAEADALRSGLGRPRLPSSSSLATPPAPTAEAMAKSGRVQSVDLANARATQPKMEWGKFESGEYPPPLIEGYADKPVAVRREDGEYLIFDGHHRAAQAIADGKKIMDMHVIDAKDYAPEFAGRKPSPDAIDTDDLYRKLFE